ncbi:MAG: hypothetical protein M3179_00610, partial [Actinomycetota bacterium]|nr:hypothetical protein [Actinomycetota bacterium]
VTVPNVDGGPPSTAGPGGPGNPAAAAAAKAAASAPPDLRGFLGGKGGGPKSSTPGLPKLPGAPDAGYDPTLPYPEEGKRRGAVQAITMGAAGLASNPRALAIPVAAGLILFMVSFHLRLLSRRMDHGGLPPGAPS